MRMTPWKWGLAIGLSGVLHAGAAAVLIPGEPEVKMAGGDGAEIALAGTAFRDMTAAGSPSEVVEPVAEAVTEISPVQPSAEAQTVDPVDTAVALPVRQAPAPVETTEPAEEVERASAAEPRAAEAATKPDEVIEPEMPQETVTAMVPVPRPTPRPHYEPPEQPRAEAENQPTPQEAARPPAAGRAAQAGSEGRDTQDAQRGATSGSRSANAAASSNTGREANRAGNAAVSNYPGKVVAKLRRSLRYPREAKRERLRGETHVAFTVAQGGSVSGIRVVKSSGSPVLDRAAVETVQRAAPFPAIPAGAGRSAWPFTVPLAFVR